MRSCIAVAASAKTRLSGLQRAGSAQARRRRKLNSPKPNAEYAAMGTVRHVAATSHWGRPGARNGKLTIEQLVA